MDYKTGTLIEFRNRPWVVQQSGEDELMIIKPLGGTDAETIGLYLLSMGMNYRFIPTIFVGLQLMTSGKTVIRHLQRCFITLAVYHSEI